MEFYHLIAQPTYLQGQPSTQRVDCGVPQLYTPPLEYSVKLLDQLQYGSEQMSFKLDGLNSEKIMALNPQLYTPDKSHPFRGIWIG